MNNHIYTVVKGYLKFNLNKDVYLQPTGEDCTKPLKKYTLDQQKKQYEKALKELKKQESKKLIFNLTFTEFDGVAMIEWERYV